MNAKIVEIVGILKLKLYHTVNIKMKWRHPKYYKELRKRNKEAQGQGRSNSELTDPASISDQVISCVMTKRRLTSGRAPGPGLKPQAASDKLQAPGVKLSNQPVQASSDKRQAPGSKLQASSHKLQAQ